MIPSPSIPVDGLSLSFVVDNSLEWMTMLPPGFTHEIRGHLSRHPPIDPMTGVPFVDLDNYCCGAHGLSILVSTTKNDTTHTILFDTGPEPHSISRNIKALETSISSIETIVLSHWHRDHSGGILEVLRLRNAAAGTDRSESTKGDNVAPAPINQPIVVDLHPSRPTARGIAHPPKNDKVIARLPEDPTFSEIEALGGVVDLHAEPHCVAGGTMYVSGEIPRVTSFEEGLLGGVRWVETSHDSPSDQEKILVGGWVSEPDIMDERYLAIDVLGKGLVILSSCSHAGICNVVQDAVDVFARPVYMIVGGLHLAGPELQTRIPPTVHYLSERLCPAPTYILPMHCTGFNAKVALQEAFGEGCVPAGAGMAVEVKGDAEGEKVLFKPIISSRNYTAP